MAFAGVRGTGDFAATERPTNFREGILFMNPNGQAPLFALSARMQSRSVDSADFSWYEEYQNVPRLRVSQGLAVGSTAVTFNAIDGEQASHGSGLDLRVGDHLMVEGAPTNGAALTNEVVTVASVTDGSNITVTRGSAGTTAALVAGNTYLLKIGNAFSEGSGGAGAGSRNPTRVANKTQIFKTAFELTGTAMAEFYRTGDPMKNDRMRKMFDHSAAIEYASLFGSLSETTGGNGKPLRTMNGLLRMISDNVQVNNGTAFTLDALQSLPSTLFNNTANGIPDQRIGYCGAGWLNRFNNLVASDSSTRFHYDGVLNLYGQSLRKYITPTGELAVKTHPLLTTNSLYTNSCIIFAPGALRYVYLRGRDTKEQKNIQNNDEDTQKNQWLTECSLELHHQSLHGFHFWDGVTS